MIKVEIIVHSNKSFTKRTTVQPWSKIIHVKDQAGDMISFGVI